MNKELVTATRTVTVNIFANCPKCTMELEIEAEVGEYIQDREPAETTIDFILDEAKKEMINIECNICGHEFSIDHIKDY